MSFPLNTTTTTATTTEIVKEPEYITLDSDSDDENEEDGYVFINYQQPDLPALEIPTEENGDILWKFVRAMDSKVIGLAIQSTEKRRILKIKNGAVQEPKGGWKAFTVFALLEKSDENVDENSLCSVTTSCPDISPFSLNNGLCENEDQSTIAIQRVEKWISSNINFQETKKLNTSSQASSQHSPENRRWKGHCSQEERELFSQLARPMWERFTNEFLEKRRSNQRYKATRNAISNKIFIMKVLKKHRSKFLKFYDNGEEMDDRFYLRWKRLGPEVKESWK